MIKVTDLWRHPIKGVGCEQLGSVALETGKTMPWDRHWALAHADAKVDYANPEWARCLNFARGARGYKLMAVTSQLDEATGKIALQHPDLNDITVNPEDASDARDLIEWVTKISDPKRSLPSHVFKADRGMTDSSAQTISILTKASLDAFAETLGAPLDQRRFRGNIWLDGTTEAWKEFDWVGKRIRIGAVELEISERIERCMATTVNPDTGVSDLRTLDTLKENWDHRDFGVFGIVTKSGTVSVNDKVEVL